MNFSDAARVAVHRAPAAELRIFKLERLKDCRPDSYSKD